MTAVGLVLLAICSVYALKFYKKGRVSWIDITMGLLVWISFAFIAAGVVSWIWRVMP